MKIEAIYYKDFKNFLITPESLEEHTALLEATIRSKTAEEYNKCIEEIIYRDYCNDEERNK